MPPKAELISKEWNISS